LFADLIFCEDGQPVEASCIGGKAYYVVPDAGFRRHVSAEYVDRQIVDLLKQRFVSMRDVITEGVAQMLGQEDIFTRASIKHAIEHMDEIFTSGSIDVDQLRTTLWMLKFRAIVDIHGDVVRIDSPGWDSVEEEDS
jgi:hypothetical protein